MAICVVLASVTLLVAVSGPFGTYAEQSFWSRLAYWSGANFTAFFIAFSLKIAVRDILNTKHFWFGEFNICLGTSLILTPLLYQWTVFWFGDFPVDAPTVLQFGINILIICVVIALLRYGFPYLLLVTGAPTAIDPLPRLVERVPKDIRSRVVRLAGEGHHVLIVTENGEARVRLRLSDAVREMDAVRGHWTHRSHWVSENAVRAAVNKSGKPMLRLNNGDTVPVSKTYKPELAKSGVL